ncbi:MAG: hypothetical protein PHU85_14045 [Phycisphaerae bacterium]|nr:hypothetical protein [Phycisphaerae bacterium]
MDSVQPTRLSVIVALLLGSLMGVCIVSLRPPASDRPAARQVSAQPIAGESGDVVKCARK